MQITLRAARINAGLLQGQVKDRTGYARSTLTSWESGKITPEDCVNPANVHKTSIVYRGGNIWQQSREKKVFGINPDLEDIMNIQRILHNKQRVPPAFGFGRQKSR